MSDLAKMLPAFRVYREPERGEQLCVFGDPADARDFCAAVAVSKKHGDFPIVYNELTESSQFGYEIEKMAKYIQHRTGFWPNVAVERNTGQGTIHVLSTLNYPNLYRMRIFDSTTYRESEKIGWLTTESTRRKMLDDLSLAARQGVAKVYDKEIIEQMFSFVVKKGKPQAESGKKDDLVMATAGAWQLYLTVPLQYADEGEQDWKLEKDKWRFR